MGLNHIQKKTTTVQKISENLSLTLDLMDDAEIFHVGFVIRCLISAWLTKNKRVLLLRIFLFFFFACYSFIVMMFGQRKEEDASNAYSGEMRSVSEIERDCNVLFCNSYLL